MILRGEIIGLYLLFLPFNLSFNTFGGKVVYLDLAFLLYPFVLKQVVGIMKKQVLFYSPYAIYPFHFETELELAEKHLNQGYEVTFLVCNGELPSCDPNPCHKPSICLLCKSRLFSGINWLGKNNIKIESFYKLTKEQKQTINSLNSIRIPSIDYLKQISIDDSDIGLAAFGSVVSNLRNPEVDLQENLDLIRKNLVAAAIVHYSLKNRLKENKPDKLIIFNGRMAPLRPALRLAQSLNIEVYVHERSGDLNRYYLIKNTYPHNLAVMKQEIELHYQNSDLPEAKKLEIAIQWFEERSNNQPQAWVSYTENQIKGMLPESFDLHNINIAIFNSSEDEAISIPEWQSSLYKNQNDGIYKIVNEFDKIDKLKFYLRVHPNLKGVNNSQTKFIRDNLSQLPNLEIIQPDSPVSTYSLIDNSDVVITFGSTVGIEAVYRGKPSILMGRALYEDLGGVILPKTHEELVNILHNYILTRSLPQPKNPQLAFIKYGFFQKTYGHPFEYVKPYTPFEVSIQRKNESEYFVRPNLYSRILAKVLRKLNL